METLEVAFKVATVLAIAYPKHVHFVAAPVDCNVEKNCL